MIEMVVEQYPALVVVAGFVGFVLSATTGVGGALMLIPFLTAKYGANAAVAVLTPVMLANNGIKAALFRHAIDRRALALTLAGAIPGAVAGALCAAYIDGALLGRAIGVLILGFITYDVFFADKTRRRVTERGLAPWGLATGLVSGVSSAAGPTNAIALVGYGLYREAFVGTGAAVSAAVQMVKLPVFVGTGALRWEHAAMTAVLCGAALVAAFTGRWILRGLDDRRFKLTLYAALAVLAVTMLV